MCGGLESGNAVKDTVDGIVRVEFSDGTVRWFSSSTLNNMVNKLDLEGFVSKQVDEIRKKWFGVNESQELKDNFLE